MNVSDSKNRVVIYHGPGCLDGFMSAAIAYRYLGDTADYVVGVYGNDIDTELFRDKTVYLLDFTYPLEVMINISKVAYSVVWLDHHEPAVTTIRDNYPGLFYTECYLYDGCEFDKSGAGLAWAHFFPETFVPALVAAVEDRDLWRFALSDTRELNAAMYSYEFDFEVFNSWIDEGSYAADALYLEGCALMRAKDKEVKMVLQSSVRMIPWGLDNGDFIEIPVCNCPIPLVSDVGNKLAQAYPFAILYTDMKTHRNFSLRSAKENLEHIDCNYIAKIYGGGGHKHAAGFRLPLGKEIF